MSGGITAIQATSPAETWEAWQALVQASLGEGGADGPHAAQGGEQPPSASLPAPAQAHAGHAPHAVVAASLAAEAPAVQVPDAPSTQPAAQGLLSGHAPHAAHHAPPVHAAAAQGAVAAPAQGPAQHARDVLPMAATPPATAADRAQAAVPSPAQATTPGLFGDAPVARFADAAGAVLPMAPVLMTPLTLQNGPELRWRVHDAAAWRALFDDAGRDTPQDGGEAEAPPLPLPDAVAVDALPDWAHALLRRLRDAATAPASAAAVRPALQAWRVGLPVLLASPAGLASLQPSRDAAVWGWRRWPARWRSARPATAERWWAVRVGLGAQGRPRTLRELAGGPSLPPGQVSCELRLGDAAAGLAHWTDVLVHAPATPSLRALLAARPSLTWLLCNRPLWPQETA